MNVEPTANPFELQSFRRAHAQWFARMCFTYAITLTFNRGDEMTPQRAEKMVFEAFGRTEREILGSRFHRLPAERRTAYLFVVEKPTTNFHLQGFARLGRGNWFGNGQRGENIHALFATKLSETWRAITQSGTCKVDPMYLDAGRYGAKAVYPEMPPDQFIASPHLSVIGDAAPR